MDETRGDDGPRGALRPMLLYPFLALVGAGFFAIALRAVAERDLGEGIHLGGMVSLAWFFYRNPRLLHGPAFTPSEDFLASADLEFAWLGLALMFAGQFVF